MLMRNISIASAAVALSVASVAAQWPEKNSSVQETQWIQVNRAKVSLSFPAGWKIQDQRSDDGGALVAATEPGGARSMSVLFMPNFVNQPDILNQCAGVDNLLEKIYETSFAKLSTGTNQYPYTTVTHDDFQPGRLGGKSTWVSIVHVEAYQLPVAQLFWLNAVPRKDGAFLVIFQHPSEPMNVSEPLRRGFTDSITFHSETLGQKDYCNYFGK